MLKQLMIRKKLERAKEALATHLAMNDFEQREANLTQALDEAQTDEEIAVVEEEIEAFNTEKATYDEKEKELQSEVDSIQTELESLAENTPKLEDDVDVDERGKDLGGITMTLKRNKFFGEMTRSEITELSEREDVKSFVMRSRQLIQEKRAVTGAELTIPQVVLELLRDNLHTYSKLLKHVNLRVVKGTARQTVLGAIPEGIWTEMVAKLNELTFGFSQIEVDGYKVGGFVSLPNSILDDSDVNLLSEVMNMIAQSIGLALDKAILYGTGNKMPVGIMTRLAETAQPAYWGSKEAAWTDLTASHLLIIEPTAKEPVDFFEDLILKLGVARPNYSSGSTFWAMNSKTAKQIQAKSLVFNAAGAIVATATNTIPIVGGTVEELEFIPDGVIIGGYGSLYLLVEREGASLESSEHAQFIEDNTVFKGTARYDGRPVFGEAFVALQIGQKGGETAPKAIDVTFTKDTANN